MDIVKRLRFWGTYGASKKDLVKYSNEAADEIEQLRKALLDAAIDEIERREELKELSESIGLERDRAFEHGFGRGEEEGLQIGYKKGYDAAMKEKE